MNAVWGLQLREQQMQDEFKEKKDKLAEDVEALRKRVVSGESTGHLILDYFITQYGVLDEEVSKPLYELEGQMAGKTGQMFLVIQTAKERWMWGTGKENEFRFYETYFFGILTGEQLVFPGRNYGLPTEKFQRVESRGTVFSVPGDFLFPIAKGVHGLNEAAIGDTKKPEFIVIIGDEEVFRKSRRTIGRVAFARVLDAFGREIPAE